MKRLFVNILVLSVLVSSSIIAQETYFGKNKVRYKQFDWKYIQTRHFDIYFYENGYPTAKFAAAVVESSYVELSGELGHHLQRRVPIFVYNSHNEFQQTNIVWSLVPEGVGGFTEVFKSRIAIPFGGSYEVFRHVLHHELTHAFQYDIIYGRMLTSLLARGRLFSMPLWYAEGMAEYSSRHGWDYWSDMFVRDATINNYLKPPEQLGGYLAYKQGQAMVKYIADKYGERSLGEILRKGKIHLSMDKAMKTVIGIDQKELWKEFSKEMKRRYWPDIASRKEANEIGKQLTHAREDGSYLNEKPTFSPEGDKIAIFTDRSDYTEIVLISADDGEMIARLVKSERSADLESLHSFVSGMSFSPDGREIVFVAKSRGKEAICFLDIERKRVYKKKRLDFYNIVSPSWSPDGKKIAFSALDGHKRDLFIYHIDTEEIEQITDDRFDDTEPSWLPNSSEIIFSSDRPHPQNPALDHLGHRYASPGTIQPGDFEYGTYNIFQVETAGLRVTPVDVGPGPNKNPTVSPDGSKIAFISNRNGTDNIYVGYLDTVRYYAVTDILTGVRETSWSPEGTQLVFSALYQGAFDIFLLKDLVPTGENGQLEPTDFVLGKYDLLDQSKRSRLARRMKSDDSTHTALADMQAGRLKQTHEPERTDVPQEIDSTATKAVDTVGDSSLAAAADDSTVAETGIYDDEYVYVSERSSSALDSLFMDIPPDSGYALLLDEPAECDSIPPLLPDGEFRVQKYKVKFTPDYVSGGFAYDTFFGLRGQSYFIFSDYLGNHQIVLATDLVSSIDQSYIQVFYLNNKHRINLGGGLFHTKNFYVDNRDFLFSDRFYGIQGFANRPFSTFSRVETAISQFFIDRKYYDRPRDMRPDRNSSVTTGSVSWVFDNVLWGYTGPVNGRRVKLTLSSVVNFFDAGDIEFQSVEFDYRKYWHFKKTFSMALRLSGGASFGETPKQYFLGGTTNWIGTRTVDTKVYEVENLYFADVVTPLRSHKYYELSGDRYGLINWEFRFPMIQYLAMRFPLPIVLSNVAGALFTDVGAAWTGDDFKGGTSQDGDSRLHDIKTGFGFGMRMNLFGFMLLRYDLAWSTDFNSISDKPHYYFSFGADF